MDCSQRCTRVIAPIAGYAAVGKVAGTKDSMKHHIKNCTNLTEEQKRTAIGEGCAVSGISSSVTNSTQAKLNKFMAVKYAPHCETEQAKLEWLALCATLSANLPWQWLQNEHVRELFFSLKPTIQLPSRKKLSG